jgi:putative membrane protein
MKKLLSILFIGCICAFAACNSGNNSNSVDSAQNINDSMLPDSNSMNNDTSAMSSTSSGPVSQQDADWAAKVANANMTEVELSKVAQTKATSDRLKNFANMMVTDHTAAGDKLKQLAASKNITLPANLDDKSQKMLDNLNKKSGKDFDKAYTDDMLDGHKDAVNAFQKGSNDLQDADLKNFATQTLPTIQMHQDSIKAIAGKK